MPRKDVDRAAFTRNLEGDLGCRGPAAARQQLERAFHHLRVIPVEQTIEFLAMPEDANEQACPELSEDSFESLNRGSTRCTALNTRDL